MTEQTLSRERHGFTNGETVLWKNTHMGLPQGNHYIWALSTVQELTTGACKQVLGKGSLSNLREDVGRQGQLPQLRELLVHLQE